MSVRVALVLIAILLAPPGQGAMTAGEPNLDLRGARTGDTYAASGELCGGCTPRIPANEWLWMELSNVLAPRARIDFRYMASGVPQRVISMELQIPAPPILIPPLRPGEDLLEVRMIEQRAERPVILLEQFLVAGDAGIDAREIRIGEDEQWETLRIRAVGSDYRAVYFFAETRARVGENPPGWVFDYEVTAPEAHRVRVAGAGLGGSNALVVSPTPHALDLGVADPLDRAGTSAAYASAGRRPIDDATLTYGRAGGSRGEVLLFSLEGSFVVERLAVGAMRTFGSTVAEGVRVHGPVNAQAAEVRAVANFTNASFVLALASGGSAGRGTAAIEHHDRKISDDIGNLFDPLRLLSHGDCSGEWSASLSGFAVSGPDTFDASLFATWGYTPSDSFSAIYQTSNGWC